LDQDATPERPAPRSPCHLGEELEGPLRRSEIGDVQADVGVDHPHEGDIGKIQTLSDHLCAEQDVDETFAENAQDTSVAAGAAHAVAIHAADGVARELVLDFGLEFFGPQPLITDLSQATFGTTLRRGLLVATVMAKHDGPLAVMRQRQVAETASL